MVLFANDLVNNVIVLSLMSGFHEATLLRFAQEIFVRINRQNGNRLALASAACSCNMSLVRSAYFDTLRRKVTTYGKGLVHKCCTVREK